MSIQINDNDLSVEVLRQSQYNARSAAGTLKEGNPYDIADVKAPEIYGGGVVQTTAPTTATVGAPGDVYIAVISNAFRIWDCVAVNGSAYTWKERLRDVTIAGTSAVTNGVGNIPIASSSDLGIVKTNSTYWIATGGGGALIGIGGKTYEQVMNAPSGGCFISTSTLQNFIDVATPRTDKVQALTNVQKAQARTNINAQSELLISADWDTLTTL